MSVKVKRGGSKKRPAAARLARKEPQKEPLRLEGSCVALVTPFRDGRVDEKTLRRLVRTHLEQGTDGLVPCGTTGEYPTLSWEETERVIAVVAEEAARSKRKVPVIAGCGTNDTAETVKWFKKLRGLGADAALVVVPYYNKPTQAGLIAHFRAIASSDDLPIVAYNIPGRTGVNMAPETLAEIHRLCPTVVAVKEASGDLNQAARILKLLSGPDFTVLCGEDHLTLPMISIGARGVISVVANLLPKETHDLCAAARQGQAAEASRLQEKMAPLVKALFLETNPIPVKTAMGMLGLCSPELRLPLTPMSPENQQKLREALVSVGLLKA